jgi:hypothetical protein
MARFVAAREKQFKYEKFGNNVDGVLISSGVFFVDIKTIILNAVVAVAGWKLKGMI